MKKTAVAILLVCSVLGALAQNTSAVYITTDNFIVRDRPEPDYVVLLVLNRNCKVSTDNTVYRNAAGEEMSGKFARIKFTYHNTEGLTCSVFGWADRHFVTAIPPAADADTCRITPVDLMPFMGELAENPNKNNRFEFPYPKFKGGEQTLTKPNLDRKYHTGARGGCYYISTSGRKVYVDKKYCRKLRQ
jgi:hypothetical protein